MTSGVVLCKEVTWITFHSGFDFGYLLRCLTGEPLPDLESDFFDKMMCVRPGALLASRLPGCISLWSTTSST